MRNYSWLDFDFHYNYWKSEEFTVVIYDCGSMHTHKIELFIHLTYFRGQAMVSAWVHWKWFRWACRSQPSGFPCCRCHWLSHVHFWWSFWESKVCGASRSLFSLVTIMCGVIRGVWILQVGGLLGFGYWYVWHFVWSLLSSC